MSNDFLGDTFSNLGKQCSKIGKAASDECSNIGKRVQKNIDDDGTEIAKGMKEHGFGGAVCSAVDVFSPGHQVGNALDEAGLVHDHNARQAIAAGVNIFAMGPVPGANVVFGLVGIAEGYDAVTGMMKPGQPQPGQPQLPPSAGAVCAPSQGNIAPSDAYEAARERAIEAAKIKSARKEGFAQGFLAGERAAGGGHVHITDPNFGYCGDVDYSSAFAGLGNNYADLLKKVGDMYSKNHTNKASDKLDDVLNDTSLCFEDKLFLLMQSVTQNGQDEIEKQGDELTKTDAANKSDRDAIDGQISKLRDQISATSAKNPQDPSLEGLRNKLAGLTDSRNEMVTDQQQSREKLAQGIQHSIEKLSEMQQSMTAILSALHDNAMNTIRNIK